ncbi:GntR family transcriptional regulator [Sporomusa aerivorans]|uniref:GntR family transcriptional regulator n=1 Tax=Sporomusa aerivorans TaxID=204936 RepID=UPI003529D899
MSKQKRTDKAVKETSTLAVKRAYDYIRDMSIDFAIRPGKQINEVDVADILKISRVPVREALNRLVVGGFAYFDPGKGFFCRKFSETEMRELYSVRFDLELGAVRQVCQEGTDNDISSILSDWEKIEDTYTSVSQEKLIQLDELFHMRIVALSGNSERIAFLQNVYERIRFVRKINIETDSVRETLVHAHLNLAQAILKHDEALATKLLEDHLWVNSQALKENIRTGMLRIYADDMS